MIRAFSVLLFISLFALVVGCSEQEVQPKAEIIVDKPAPVALLAKIIVPKEVAGQWRLVRIAVRDQLTGVEDIYAVDIGGGFQLPDSTLRVTVETFLPAFIMDGKRITSASNQATNPAARIIIEDAGKEIYQGWLFGLYPDTHAFQHPRYNFTLLGYEPSR